VVVGAMWINGDKTVSFVHYGFENWQVPIIQKFIFKFMSSETYLDALSRIAKPSYITPVLTSMGYGMDFPANSDIVDLYKTNGGEDLRDKLLQEWAGNRKVPAQAEDLLFLGLIHPGWQGSSK
jgi:hypothetical protein